MLGYLLGTRVLRIVAHSGLYLGPLLCKSTMLTRGGQPKTKLTHAGQLTPAKTHGDKGSGCYTGIPVAIIKSCLATAATLEATELQQKKSSCNKNRPSKMLKP